MEIVITKKAQTDLYNFFNISRPDTENYVISYIYDLIDYTELLSKFSQIGKIVDYIESFEIRQLLHKKHKILYTIYNSKIYILRFVHTSQNFNLKKNLNLIDFPKY